MSIQININNTIIDFPSSAQSPNWAPALVEFAQNVEAALNAVGGPYDISPQVISILNDGNEHKVQTPSTPLAFSTAAVRSASIRYSLYRKSDNVTTNITTIIGQKTATATSVDDLFIGAKVVSTNVSGTITNIVGTTITLDTEATASGTVSGTFSLNHSEAGTMVVVYNTATSTWEMQRDFIGNVTPIGGQNSTTNGITFRIDSSGQVYYTADKMATAGYVGTLSFAAQALTQTS